MKEIEIYKVPEGRRYWLVRSQGGGLYDHFISSGVVGISHLDFKFESGINSKPLSVDLFMSSVLSMPNCSIVDWAFPEKKKGEKSQSDTLKKNQSKLFVDTMSIGDWVITVTNNAVRFGLITSDAYISNEAMLSELHSDQPEDGTNIRRSVDWGPEIPRHLMSAKMASKLRSQQTVVCLDELVADIHHYLFPIFLHDSSVYVSISIGRPTDIPLREMTQLFVMVNEYNKKLVDTYGVDASTVKAYFFSEGQLRLKNKLTREDVYFVIDILMQAYGLFADGDEADRASPNVESAVVESVPSDTLDERNKDLTTIEVVKETTTTTTITTTTRTIVQDELKLNEVYFDTSPLRSRDEDGLLIKGSELEKMKEEYGG